MATGASRQILPAPVVSAGHRQGAFSMAPQRCLQDWVPVAYLNNTPLDQLSLPSYFSSLTLNSIPLGTSPQINYESRAIAIRSVFQVNCLKAIPVTWSVDRQEICEAESFLRDSWSLPTSLMFYKQDWGWVQVPLPAYQGMLDKTHNFPVTQFSHI